MPTIYELTSWLILAQAEGNGNGGGNGGDGGGDPADKPSAIESCGPMIFPMVLIFVLFYFMMMRPQAKERKKLQEMLNNMKKNDRVVTAGGILGTVVNAQKESPYVTIKIDEQSNTKMKVRRSSIISIETDDTEEKKDKEMDSKVEK